MQYYDGDTSDQKNSTNAYDCYQQYLGWVNKQLKVPIRLSIGVDQNSKLTVWNNWSKDFDLVKAAVDAVRSIKLLKVIITPTNSHVNVWQLETIKALLWDLSGHSDVLVVVLKGGHDVPESSSRCDCTEPWVFVRICVHHLRLNEETIIIHVIINKPNTVIVISSLNEQVHLSIFIDVNWNHHGARRPANRGYLAKARVTLKLFVNSKVPLILSMFIVT